jgi:hypothetical protein
MRRYEAASMVFQVFPSKKHKVAVAAFVVAIGASVDASARVADCYNADCGQTLCRMRPDQACH